MEIRQYKWDVVDSNSWLITEENQGLLIDAVENKSLYAELVHLDDLIVILTHSHFDHIIGLNRIREIRPAVTVISTENCSKYLINQYRNMSSSANAFLKFYNNGYKSNTEVKPFVCEPADRIFTDKMILTWSGHLVKLLAVHGHTDDSLLTEIDGEILFSGDTLLAIPTVTRFPTGSSARFWGEDLPILRKMNHIKCVYPGHGNPGTLEKMIAANQKI